MRHLQRMRQPPRGSAEDNGYTGRGSGTSYATPSVSGILAMMIEANPDLTTAEMKEILKLTAERRGEASAPDVDPFWNRDFGWGMVDAYEAVKLAMHLAEENLTGTVDVSTQVHILNSSVNATTGLHELGAWLGDKQVLFPRLNSARTTARGWRPLTKPWRAARLRSSDSNGWSPSTLTASTPAIKPLKFVDSTNKRLRPCLSLQRSLEPALEKVNPWIWA